VRSVVTNKTGKSPGFIRVRRHLWASRWPDKIGSRGYDLVRSVRINGKPTHKFVLSLGSLKDERPERGKYSLTEFWITAIKRMQYHGLDKAQRYHLAQAVMRKGVSLPSPEQCRWHKLAWPLLVASLDEVIGWLRQR
jgi:hypothetical protein